MGRLGSSPIHTAAFLARLSTYPFKRDRDLLASGFLIGFSLGCSNVVECTRIPVNLPSARALPDVVRQKIAFEVKAGRVAGPYTSPPMTPMRFSPLGLVPKREPGSFRLIHHLSWPRGQGVNNAIPDELAAVTYTKFDTVVTRIHNFGKGTLLWKADIKDSFRLLPVRKSDQQFLGFSFDGQFFIDLCLANGVKSSCRIFEKFSTFLNFCAETGITDNQKIYHYLDDFLGMIKASAVHEPSQFDYFKLLCAELNIPLASHKLEGPCTSLIFLGLEIDTVLMQVRIPSAKICVARSKLLEFLGVKRISLRRLQSLLGTLNFLSRAIRPGRAFSRRLFDLCKTGRSPVHRIRIPKSARLDAVMWLSFLQEFNGITPILAHQWDGIETLRMATDASSTFGYGAYFQRQWFLGAWPVDLGRRSMALLEIFPIVLAIRTFGEVLKNRRLIVFSDNEAVTRIINKQSSRCANIACLLRDLTLSCLRYNIVLQARFLRSEENKIADALSRGDVAKFRFLAPDAQVLPTPTPSLDALLLKLKFGD